jgi:hypothetical protein
VNGAQATALYLGQGFEAVVGELDHRHRGLEFVSESFLVYPPQLGIVVDHELKQASMSIPCVLAYVYLYLVDVNAW